MLSLFGQWKVTFPILHVVVGHRRRRTPEVIRWEMQERSFRKQLFHPGRILCLCNGKDVPLFCSSLSSSNCPVLTEIVRCRQCKKTTEVIE